MPKESDAALRQRIFAIRSVFIDEPVYAWDLDSTICSTMHRRHMVDDIRAGRASWDDYAMRCVDDTPILGTVALMRELNGSHIAISGRGGRAEELTWAWFRKHNVPVDATLLRIDGDHTPNGIYKVRVLRALREAGADIKLYFEDWGEVAAQIASETGIPVVGINPFDPKELGERQGAV